MKSSVLGIDPIILGGATHLRQNTLQSVEEEVFLQINKLSEPSSIFFSRNIFITSTGLTVNVSEGKTSSYV